MKLAGATNRLMPAWLKRIVPKAQEDSVPGSTPLPDAVPAGGYAVTAAGSDIDVSISPPANDASSGGAPPAALHVPLPAPKLALEASLWPLNGAVETKIIIPPNSEPFRIGRDGICELQLYDVRISRRHAQIEFLAGEYVLNDLSSANGVYVNGNRLAGPIALRTGDTIELGGFGGITFRFELAQPD